MSAGGLLIVSADDLGYNAHHTNAILQCARDGQITSSSAMVFMQDSDRASSLAREADIGIGLHLNLSEAFSDPDTPLEVRTTQARLLGRFRGTRARQLHRWLYDPTIREDVNRTIEHQLDRFRALYGRSPTHIDGHQHVHLSPSVLRARQMPAPARVRRGLDRPARRRSPGTLVKAFRQHQLEQRFACTNWFFDIADVDPRSDPERSAELLGRSNTQAVEVMAHPGFEHERARLVAPEWRRALEGRPVGSYADLPFRR